MKLMSRQTTEETEYIQLDRELELDRVREREMLVQGSLFLSADGINTIIYNSKMFLFTVIALYMAVNYT